MRWPDLPRSRRLPRLTIALLAAAGVAVLLLWRGPDWSEVGRVFTDVSWPWVLAALSLNVISVLIRVLCWWIILKQALPSPPPGYSSVLSAFAVGLLANAVLPGRGGEIARIVVLHGKLQRREGLWPLLIGTVIAYRLLDLIPAIVLAVWVVLTAPLPSWAYSSLLAVISAGTALFLAGVVIALGEKRDWLIEKVGPVRQALAYVRHGLASLLRSRRTAFWAASFQVLGWLCQLLAVWTAMRAFGIDLPLSAAALVLVLMNITIILPLWTGNVGLVQAAIAIPLINYGINYSRGFAYGIGLQAIEASVGVGYGLFFLAREGISFAALREAGASTPGENERPGL